MKKEKILCSACLLGTYCRYDGKIKPNQRVLNLLKDKILIPICPEQLGGLKTPRNASGIMNGDGNGVIAGKAKVINRKGDDWTENYINGAETAFKIAKLFNIKTAILKQGSPSCGCGSAFQWEKVNNKLSNRRRRGDGVTAALFKKNGIRVITENDL